LQHYALGRDIEIAVIDAARGLGNGLPLPAGPLREPQGRLARVDAVVRLGGDARSEREFAMTLVGERFVRVSDSAITADAAMFRSGAVHAIAGIGDPARFFAQLAALGIGAVCHPFPDHHRYTAADLALPGAVAILMTEKDAVKCRTFADERCWALPVSATVEPALFALVERGLRGSKTA
jgi:tetraacyldisaccharide 4'-kinase